MKEARHKDEAMETAAAPRGLAGTRLVHYGPLWDTTLQAEKDTPEGPVAVLICHGMGQQVRYETISDLAEAILNEAKAEVGAANVSPVEVHLAKQDDSFLARAEIAWTDAKNVQHNVHVYEAYWAPLTEGQVSYWDTVKFLLSAAWNGIMYSHPFGPRTFQRWMFGDKRTLHIARFTFYEILAVLAFLFAQVAIIGFVLTELADQYKAFLAQPLPSVSLHRLVSFHGREMLLAWAHLVYSLLRWLGPFFPGHSDLIYQPIFSRAWCHALALLVLWFAAIAEALVARYFIVEYVGDVAAYISPYKDSKFDELRQKIQDVGLSVGKVIYGFGPSQAGAAAAAKAKPEALHASVPDYKRVVVAGHSLGSVLAYDTLNALINLDNVAEPGERRNVVHRTRALVTFGSPLDKTAFIFRMQARNQQDWIREQLAASVQPLIVDYRYRRFPWPADTPPPFEWVNIWSPMDIISGSLAYYDNPDDPRVTLGEPPCVVNMRDPRARIPIYAHIQYWGNPTLGRQLYRFVT